MSCIQHTDFESLIFVALDLETTGLSPETDTIIEVAAVQFQIQKENNQFFVKILDERSMLINPGIELKEEVTMITGISQNMLEGKSKWSDIRDRVWAFIGDHMIVGHNVLFDLAMLKTHGISLDSERAIDTFELSEIFSQEVESLNLWFLAKYYGIHTDSEHRALDDTKLSIHLFCTYINLLQGMSIDEKSIWNTIARKEQWGSLYFLQHLLFPEHTDIYSLSLSLSGEGMMAENYTKCTMSEKKDFSYISYSWHLEEEINTLHSLEKKDTHVIIITTNQKQSEFLGEQLTQRDKKNNILFSPDEYLSITCLIDFLEKTSFSRKETVFLIKILFWSHSSRTQLLKELKYYGDERIWMNFLRSESLHENPKISIHNNFSESASYKIIDIHSYLQHPDIIKTSEEMQIYIRDIPLLENIFRRYFTQKIAFQELNESLYELCIPTEHEQFALEYIRHIYENIMNRPNGEHPFPPGNHGETYFFTQKELWHRWNEGLLLATQVLKTYLIRLNATLEDASIIRQRRIKTCIEKLSTFIQIHEYWQNNIGIIIDIQSHETTVSFIPRSIEMHMQTFLNQLPASNILLAGYYIHTMSTKKFLETECGFPLIQWYTHTYKTNTPLYSLTNFKENQSKENQKTVILTTSMKHIRTLSQEAKKTGRYATIITQGISGWKAKMLSNFQNASTTTILIGLIDSWIDESPLWKEANTVVLWKIPFEPPTDPYFLARTIGMRNNFEEYSLPSTIITLQTLIGRIRSGGNISTIECLDERLETTTWGIDLRKELL